MSVFLSIPYSTPSDGHRDPFREFDLYVCKGENVPATDTPPLICFVHGGAWRSEDKTDHSGLASKLCTFTGFPVAVPNYRLTTQSNHFRHPGHAEDILQFLSFLLTWKGVPEIGRVFDHQRIYLIGHSCSAHMLGSIFLDSSAVTPSLSPPPSLLQAVQAIIVSEGIYDLDLLLTDFPKYLGWFIGPTFGKLESYQSFSVTRLPLRSSNIRWFIIHSRGDTLINEAQSVAMYSFLYTQVGPSNVSKNMHQLRNEHNEILKGNEYISIVGGYIDNDASKSIQ